MTNERISQEKSLYGLKVTRLSDVEPADVQWFWDKYIPYGKVTLLAGDPGLGKSWVTLDLAAKLTVGGQTPDRLSSMDVGSVILLTAEDGLADTVRPRIDGQGGDSALVHAVNCTLDPTQHGRILSLVDDTIALELLVRELDAKLVIIDPLNAFTGGTDSHVDAQVRRALTPLTNLAENTGAAVLVVMHLNQSTLQPALYRVQGSVGFVGAARSVLIVVRDNDNPDMRLMVPIKANLSGDMPAVRFTITDEPVLEWHGTVEVDVADLLAPQQPKTGNGKPSALARAQDFLMELLVGGPLPADTVFREGSKEGFSERTIQRAKNSLSIKSEKIQQEGKKGADHWVWSLPDSDRQLPLSPDGGVLNNSG